MISLDYRPPTRPRPQGSALANPHRVPGRPFWMPPLPNKNEFFQLKGNLNIPWFSLLTKARRKNKNSILPELEQQNLANLAINIHTNDKSCRLTKVTFTKRKVHIHRRTIAEEHENVLRRHVYKLMSECTQPTYVIPYRLNLS